MGQELGASRFLLMFEQAVSTRMKSPAAPTPDSMYATTRNAETETRRGRQKTPLWIPVPRWDLLALSFTQGESSG